MGFPIMLQSQKMEVLHDGTPDVGLSAWRVILQGASATLYMDLKAVVLLRKILARGNSRIPSGL